MEHINLAEIDAVCGISGKEHEGLSSLWLKAPHIYIPDTRTTIRNRPGSVHEALLLS